MTFKRLLARANVKRLAFGIPAIVAASLSAIQLLELRDIAQKIDFSQTADPVWIGSQLGSEIRELHSAILQYELGQLSSAEVNRQLNVAWSRLRLMNVGKLSEIIEDLNVPPERLRSIEIGFEDIEASLLALSDPSDDARAEPFADIASEMANEAHHISIELAQQRSQLISAFRASLLNVSNVITLLFAAYLILTATLMAFGARELKLSKQHNKALSDLRKKDFENLRARERMMSTISHELRTPLTSILGGLKLIKGGAAGSLPPRAMQIVDVSERNSSRLLNLVNEILDVRKMSSGEWEVDRKTGDLKVALQNVIDEIRGFAETDGVAIETETPPCEALANFDEARLGQAISNVVSNAIKFSPEGEIVKVSLFKHGEYWRISVKDRGPGIPSDEYENIFQSFHQVNPGSYANHKSSGLGLSIARQIVKAHDGSIGLESAIGDGTCFWIDIPTCPPASKATEF